MANDANGTGQKAVLLTEGVRFVFRRGGSRIHIMRVRDNLRMLRALCGRVISDGSDGSDGPEARMVLILQERNFPVVDLCTRCLALAQQKSPAIIQLQPYTEADRQREQREAADAMQRILVDHD